MDIFDQATVQEELARELSIAAARNKPPVLIPNGICYNCLTELIYNDSAARCFCDADCHDDWQARNQNK
jgi:hypothetical protein